jgi:2-amino-4-hydroxy-6-hydroxymethyldihydropteridine diphosphokinase
MLKDICDGKNKMQKNIFLSLGSNIGGRAGNLSGALSFLQSNGVFIERLSSLYETAPIGPHQRNFYNLCLKARSNLTAENLLILIKDIENAMGRKKTKHWGARIIDIDILFFGQETFDGSHLTIPHKEIKKRLFVLAPLNEIAPNFKNAFLGARVKEILSAAPESVKKQKVALLRKYL